jgi:hypothetical protein
VIIRKAKRIGYFGIKEVQEGQVPILWDCDEGRTKVERTVTSYRSRQQGMPEGSLSVMSVTMSVPRAGDEENHFPARRVRQTKRQSSCPPAVTGMSTTIVTRSH